MKQWLERHLQTLVGSLGRLWQQPFAALLTILVIGIALALPACLHTLVQNVRAASGGWGHALDVSLYMKQATGRRRGDGDRGRRRTRGVPQELGVRRGARRARQQPAAARARGAAGRRLPFP